VCFQTSDGGPECFKDMKVGVFKEIVPMGMDPDVISYQLAGKIICWYYPNAYECIINCILCVCTVV